MLYITTKNKNDAHTANHALGKDTAADGSLYIPFQLPKLSAEQIGSLKEKSFGQNIAEILNLFFSARLDGWDVDFCIGRYPTKLVSMSHKIVVAQTWNNPDWEYFRMVRNLYTRISGSGDCNGSPSNWAVIAIRIATLFGLYAELFRNGALTNDQSPDIAVAEGDLSSVISAIYAKQMGLPIGNIICGCDEESGLWELLHRNMVKTPLLPMNFARLIYLQLGNEETAKFYQAQGCGNQYVPNELIAPMLRNNLFAEVISAKRIASIIDNVYKVSTYILDPEAAMAYGALQDYRTKAGERKLTLLITDRSPIRCSEAVSFAMGISQQELKERITNI